MCDKFGGKLGPRSARLSTLLKVVDVDGERIPMSAVSSTDIAPKHQYLKGF